MPPFSELIGWTVLTVLRLYFPERPIPFGYDPVWFQQHRASGAQNVLVGARDIRDDRRRMMRARPPEVYRYLKARQHPSGIPDAWCGDLWDRRN